MASDGGLCFSHGRRRNLFAAFWWTSTCLMLSLTCVESFLQAPAPGPVRKWDASTAVSSSQPFVRIALRISAESDGDSAIMLQARGKGKGKGGEQKKTYTKSNLPSKTCEVCGRPFEWRKKWEKVWDDVKYCSDRCRKRRSSNPELDT